MDVESTMLPLGTKMPSFELLGIDGKTYTNEDFADKLGTLVMFICNHCPFVKHVNDELVNLTNELLAQNIGVIGINSNDSSQEKYAEDSFEKMKEYSQQLGYKFPYVVDTDQSAAKSFTAQCTPDFFLFDNNGSLIYRGQLDGSRPGNDKPVDGESLRNAVSSMLAGEEPLELQLPSMGCNIKWKIDEEPDYFLKLKN
ncbi:thioredoxin family protein [Acidimicrobiaceae bacterium]|jgi:peroxiredoxin|nr:thioredoxin family protein [Acidimicrobiaceae bacterium]|tara:strand:+ start:415 stop:1008 length:594 start_codon:yes stop_codon:yes gene_type:complete